MISDRVSKTLTWREKNWKEVDKGIHVYLKKPSRSPIPDSRLVKVLCNVEDFVGCNADYNFSKEAVFTKVFLENNSWKKLREDCGYLHP